MAELKVLMVDDDEDDYFILKEMFGDFPICELTYINNGAALMDHLNTQADSEQNFPHLILLDINMPKMNGMEALKLMKSSPVLSLIPVIMHTTADDHRIREKCFKLGADGFRCKDNCLSGMLSLIHSIIFLLREMNYRPLNRHVDNLKGIPNQKLNNFRRK